MTQTEDGTRTYPITHDLQGQPLTIRYMARGDADAIVAFARTLPEHDLLFLRRDITQPQAVESWMRDIDSGLVTTLLAEAGGNVVGYATVHRNGLRWTAHVAELRVMIGPGMRGKGLGHLLTQEAFAVALGQGVEKMVAQMTLDQKGAITVFEGIGFRPEALLRDQVRDAEGQKHDILVLSHDVADFESKQAAYGLGDAFGA